jgi:hypothetical protein
MAIATDISISSPAWHSSLATFFPGYFALVMATGIVSLAAHCFGHEYLARALLWLNVFAYAVLWAITDTYRKSKAYVLQLVSKQLDTQSDPFLSPVNCH